MIPIIVKGKIQDEYGPTPGATIKELGTNRINAVISDNLGNFSIIVGSLQSELEITFIGLKTTRIKASDVSVANPIYLETASYDIEPIVITGKKPSKIMWWVGGAALIGALFLITKQDEPKTYKV